MQRQCGDIESFQRRIKAFEEKNIPKKLEAVRKAIENLQREMNDVRMKKTEANKSKEEIKSDLQNQKAKELELEDNLKFREKCKQAEKCKKEIAELEEKFGTLNFDAVLKEKRRLRAEEEKINQQVCKSDRSNGRIMLTIFIVKLHFILFYFILLFCREHKSKVDL